MRQVISTAPLPAAALGELKQWLAISTPAQDEALGGLLNGAIDMCEAFVGQRPIEAEMRETVVADGTWQTLLTRPLRSIDRVEALASDGSVGSALDMRRYEIDIDLEAVGRVRAREPGVEAVAVHFRAGMAPDWPGLPASIRHGIVRLAAAMFRARDEAEAPAALPASVAALWQPYRRMGLGSHGARR